MKPLPSIRRRLTRALLLWSLLWLLSVSLAVWWAVRVEVNEVLDDTLRSATDVVSALVCAPGIAMPSPAPRPVAQAGAPDIHVAWQLVSPTGQLLNRSSEAPLEPWHTQTRLGLSEVGAWRIFGVIPRPPSGAAPPTSDPALPRSGCHSPTESSGVRPGADNVLYMAQITKERSDAQAEVSVSAALIALLVGLLGYLWLRFRVDRELQPLRALSERLSQHDPLDASASLDQAECLELQPVHMAIDGLARRLNSRIARERAFAGHAAHALRTPLAGIDAQLAVALRECPPALHGRLQRTRDAAGRLQRVIAALLALFRTSAEPQRQAVDLPRLLSRLPLEGLSIKVDAGHVNADPDLLSAALLNLLDNSLRCGATQAHLSIPAPHTLCVTDNGPGVDDTKRKQLQAALAAQTYEGQTGLGLMLADMVARAHGGGLQLRSVDQGFSVEMRLASAGNDESPP